jgi:hypothetical protein
VVMNHWILFKVGKFLVQLRDCFSEEEFCSEGLIFYNCFVCHFMLFARSAIGELLYDRSCPSVFLSICLS